MSESTYDEREARLRRFYAAVHTDRLLSSAHAAMKVADDEQADLRARLAHAKASGLREYADDLAANSCAVGWDHAEFVNDAREYADTFEREVTL